MINFNQITPELFVGSFPKTIVDAQRLRKGTGVSAILNLQTDQDFADWGVNWQEMNAIYRDLEMSVERVPILDFDSVDLRQNLRAAVDRLDRLVSLGHRVYVHCTAGIGRAPATVIAYLVWHKAWPLDEAVTHVKNCRPCAPSVDAIRLALEEADLSN